MDFLSTYVLTTYILPLHHKIDKLINLNKLNTLKHGNNTEILKTWFSMNCQTTKYLFQEFKYFFSIGVSQTEALLSLLLLKCEKLLQKGYS